MTIRIACAMWVAAGWLPAQEAAKPEFEVASVKLDATCTAGRGGGMGRPSPGRMTIKCSTLENLIRGAYVLFANGPTPDMRRIDITGGPAWTRSELYSIAAKAEDAAPVVKMYGPMLQGLLEDRFKLKIHRDTKEGSVYVLTVAKSGAKLKATPEGSCVPLDLDHLPPEATPAQALPNFCGNQRMRGNGKTFNMSGTGVSMKDFAGMFSNILEHPVIDKTGLTGRFDVELEFSPDGTMFGGRGGGAGIAGPGTGMPVATDPEGPTIFMAIEKLGLRLEPAKGPVEMLVIDHVEKPVDN